MQNIFFIGLHNAAIHYHLIYYEMSLFYVVHNVQLAHIVEISIESFDHIMDEFKHGEFVTVRFPVYPDDKVKRGVSPVDHFELSVLEERTLFVRSAETFSY